MSGWMPPTKKLNLSEVRAKLAMLTAMVEEMDGKEVPADDRFVPRNSQEQKDWHREQAEVNKDLQFMGHASRTIATDIDSIYWERRGFRV